jgi:hypothetical protein
MIKSNSRLYALKVKYYYSIQLLSCEDQKYVHIAFEVYSFNLQQYDFFQ